MKDVRIGMKVDALLYNSVRRIGTIKSQHDHLIGIEMSDGRIMHTSTMACEEIKSPRADSVHWKHADWDNLDEEASLS